MLSNVKLAIRQLVKSPGFAVVALLTLALGIGACTAMFSIVEAVLLKPMDITQPQRLVVMWPQFGDTAGNFYLTYPDDPKASFLSELGFEFPPEIAETVTANDGEEVSYENLDLMDQDVAVWIAGVESPELVAELREDPIYAGLDVAREGRDLFLEEGVDELSWGTVLSIPAALEVVVPQLADVVAGTDG